MRAASSLVALTLLTAAAPISVVWAAPSPIENAVRDANRPASDTSRDAGRKPAELLAFAGMKPGMVVVDMLPGLAPRGLFHPHLRQGRGPEGPRLCLFRHASMTRG